MKFSEPNSAECYEQSECQLSDNQKLADNLDNLDLLVFQISNSLRAARIMVQRDDQKIDLDWANIPELTERLAGVLVTVRLINESVKRQVVSDCKVDPTEYVRNS